MNTMTNRMLLAIALSLTAACCWAGSFDTYHPDQFNQKKAFDLYKAGDIARSVPYFKRAARYGDKPSQLAVAMLYFNGEGVEKDPAIAYAWADVAAERGYRSFLATREQIWASLDAAQQERAIAEGRKLYAEYGDVVAKRRLNNLLRQGLAQRTGSRAGSKASAVGVAEFDSSAVAAFRSKYQTSYFAQPQAGGGMPEGEAQIATKLLMRAIGSMTAYTAIGYYDGRNWQPKEYWRWQDRMWSPEGTVEVLPLRAAPPTN